MLIQIFCCTYKKKLKPCTETSHDRKARHEADDDPKEYVNSFVNHSTELIT